MELTTFNRDSVPGNPISTDLAVNVNDPLFTQLQSAYLEASGMSPSDINTYDQLKGFVGGLGNMSNVNAKDTAFKYGINMVNMPDMTGTVTISKIKPQKRSVSIGDGKGSVNDVLRTESVKWAIGPQQWYNDDGFLVDTDMVNTVAPYSFVREIQLELKRQTESFPNEQMIITAAGRAGNSLKNGFGVFGKDNETLNTDRATQVRSNMEYQSAFGDSHNAGTGDLEPTQQFAPWTPQVGGESQAAAWQRVRIHDPKLGLAGTGDTANQNKISYELITDLAEWCGDNMASEYFLGAKFENPARMSRNDTGNIGGSFMRSMVTQDNPALFITRSQKRQIQQLEQEQRLHHSFIEFQGVKNGYTTGGVGSIGGIDMYVQHLSMTYPGGVAGNTSEIQRAIMFGRGSMVGIMPRYKLQAGEYRNVTRTYAKQMMSMGPLYRFYNNALGRGNQTSINWETWLTYVQPRYSGLHPDGGDYTATVCLDTL